MVSYTKRLARSAELRDFLATRHGAVRASDMCPAFREFLLNRWGEGEAKILYMVTSPTLMGLALNEVGTPCRRNHRGNYYLFGDQS
jgi:hypothetical protein